MIQIIESDDNAATVTDGRNRVEVVRNAIGQIVVAVDGARFPRIYRTVEDAVAGYKRAAIRDLVEEAATQATAGGVTQ